ncbi:ATP-binding protein, putative [Psychroflexus torquis ATCC 700755]|jgi:uncharacterized protein YydD (DUF2326 family)|uniref:ATP-binding protein, putative n=1 Tax=Psychroflexus torquis (strain ATCC 700755 / CIP 106069 / ACAM 623) TaxID=313595 RepID=K4IE39_PSYTT|nr:DUF2326 domain-containing protein [Psychroflexus torquis]AFU68108.1 ATP-binding protein, putative [Psychroflexus torquis ATCC 700755]
MKISKIYSNKNFKNIEFNDKFNAIIAFIESDKKDDTHNLGKTSLIRVIDFLLLSGFDKNTDKLLGNNIFIGQEFYGELKLNSSKYLIIKRSINTPTKISFKLNDSKLDDFKFDIDWDEELTLKKAKARLNEYLDFSILPNWDYRKSITYFLRSQQDYLDVFKLNKFKGKHKDWKPFVFDLLGFNGELILEKLEVEEEIDDLKKKIQTLRLEAQIDTSEKDRLEGLLEIKKNELSEIKDQIDKFNFFKEDIQTNSYLVEEIDVKLQAFNTDRYRISYEINKIESSLSDINDDVDDNAINSLFNEVNLYYPEQLKKEYNDLINFQKSLTIERKKYLSETLSQLKIEYSDLNLNIKEIENQKGDLLSLLTQKDSYHKFKEYQKKTIGLEVDIERIKDKLKAIDSSLIIENDIKEKRELIKDNISKLKESLSERKHSSINKIFNSIIKEIIDTNALISLKLNNQGNVEFNADYQNKIDLIKTSESQGTTYKKLLCVAFDLSLLVNFSDRSFFKFVYHDGVLEGLDDRIKIRYIKIVKDFCEKYDLQYIVTLIDSDLPKDMPDLIEDKDICLRLNDKDANGKLFLNSF